MKSIYRVRQERLMEKLEAKNIQKALVTNSTNIFYLTGASIIPYERFLGLVLDIGTKVSHLIVPGFEKGHVQDEGTREVPYPDSEDPLLIARDLIRGGQRIGMDKKNLPVFIMERLLSLLDEGEPGVVRDTPEIDSFLEEMRLHKDEDEIAKIREAGRYAGKILDQVRHLMKPGVSEQEIKFAIFQGISEEEALMGPACPIQVSSGIHSSLAHGMAGNRKLEPGDQVIIDYGVLYAHYRSDITRTFFVGKPREEFAKIYQIVREAQEIAIETVRPGVKMKEVDLAARRYIEKAGYGPYFLTRVGHGLGLEIHEPPSVHGENEQLIEEGMVFTIEPGIYLPGVGGVRIEDDIAVIKEGVVMLTGYAKDLQEVVVG